MLHLSCNRKWVIFYCIFQNVALIKIESFSYWTCFSPFKSQEDGNVELNSRQIESCLFLGKSYLAYYSHFTYDKKRTLIMVPNFGYVVQREMTKSQMFLRSESRHESRVFPAKKQISDWLTYLVYQLEACFFWRETIWAHVLTWISEKTNFKRQHTTLIHTIACLDLYRAQTTTTHTPRPHKTPIDATLFALRWLCWLEPIL